MKEKRQIKWSKARQTKEKKGERKRRERLREAAQQDDSEGRVDAATGHIYIFHL